MISKIDVKSIFSIDVFVHRVDYKNVFLAACKLNLYVDQHSRKIVNVTRKQQTILIKSFGTLLFLVYYRENFFFCQISTSTLLEIFTFDQNNDRYYQQLIQLAEQYVCQQTLLPVKFRFKLSSIQTFLSTIFLEIGRLFINNRHFHSFDLNDRLYFLKYQFKYILIFCSSIILHQSHLCDYQAFQQSIELLFDRMIFHRNHLFHIDIIYRKLSLQMISFCLLNFDYSSDNIRNRIYLKRMFNFYIELLSKYLLDVYDEKQQIKYLVNFNRCLFQLIDDVIRLETKQTFFDLINFVIQDIENKLIR